SHWSARGGPKFLAAERQVQPEQRQPAQSPSQKPAPAARASLRSAAASASTSERPTCRRSEGPARCLSRLRSGKPGPEFVRLDLHIRSAAPCTALAGRALHLHSGPSAPES